MKRRWGGAVLSVAVSMVTGAGVLLAPGAASVPDHPTATSVAPATAAPLGTLTVNDASVYADAEATFKGQLPERVSSRKILLQVRMSGVWRTVERGYTKQAGRFVVETVLEYPAGRYTFRVLGKRSRLYGVGESKTRTVTITLANRPGSMELPWRPGQRFALDDWSVVFGVTDMDAWPELMARNTEEDPPPPGWSWISVPMQFTRTASDSGAPWLDLSLGLVGGDGVVYSSFATVNGKEYSCYLADDWLDAPELYTGGVATASDCMLVPQAALPGALWRISDGTAHFITTN